MHALPSHLRKRARLPEYSSSGRIVSTMNSDRSKRSPSSGEAVCDSARGRGDAGRYALELGFLHAERPGRSAEAHDAQLDLTQAGGARLMRDGETNFRRRLGTDAMDAEGRQQADDAVRGGRTR